MALSTTDQGSMRVSLSASTAISSPSHDLSDEQLAIALFIKNNTGNLVVRARAGTGKTYLIIQCLPLMRGKVAIAAYNRKIADEIRAKVQAAGFRNVDVATFHSFGSRVLRKHLPDIRLEGRDKGNAGFIKFDVIAERLSIPQHLKHFVRKAIERAQERLFGVVDPATQQPFIRFGDKQAWLDLVSHHALEESLPDEAHIEVQMLRKTLGNVSFEDARNEMVRQAIVFAAKGMQESIRMARETFHEQRVIGKGDKARLVKGVAFSGVHSFGEMMYLPLYFNMPMTEYENVCVDEAQDSNPARREMAYRMCSNRMMFVGDDRQAINGWAGADNDSLDIIVKRFGCTVLPMTVTFRCAKAIVRLAQRFVPDYKAAENNPEGIVRAVTEAEFEKEVMRTGAPRFDANGDLIDETCDAIICRNTAPLIKVAYKLLGRGVACHVEGRDIGKGLNDLLYRWPHLKTTTAYLSKLQEYAEKEIAKLKEKDQEAAAEALSDKVETIQAIIESLPKGSTLADVQTRVDSLFSDTKPGEKAQTVTLLTAHRSKGLEFTRVFGLGVSKYMPSKFAKSDWSMIQEENLEYVLYTRAIFEYVDINVA